MRPDVEPEAEALCPGCGEPVSQCVCEDDDDDDEDWEDTDDDGPEGEEDS